MKNLLTSVAIQFLQSLPGAAVEVRRKANVDSLREVFCYNQGRLADYYFLANHKHKKLREKLDDIQQKGCNANDDFLALGILLEDLSDYLHKEFRTICDKNFGYLKEFYIHRSGANKQIRICVKAIRNSRTITIVRDRYSATLDEEYPFRSNSAFTYIDQNSQYFLCNQVPQKSRRGEYRNPRLYQQDVFQFYKQGSLVNRAKYRFSKSEDIDWQRCWKRPRNPAGEEVLPTPESCYKSTLVIPMTLVTNDSSLSQEFRNNFKIRYGSSKVVIGYLCFDHRNQDFFNSKDDVDLGYIFADILSLYLIQYMNCTEYSSVFQESLQLLRDQGIPINWSFGRGTT